MPRSATAVTRRRERRSTSSCRRPFVHTKLPPSASARPSSVLQRPPASSMIGTSAATSHRRHDRIDRDVERAFGDEHVLPEVADAARAPAAVRELRAAGRRCRRRRTARAVSHANEICASSSADDRRHADACRRRGTHPARGRPTSACCSAGADTTPTHELARVLEADQRRPDRHAAHVVLGAVDRVDDPAELGIAATGHVSPNSSPSTAWSVDAAEPVADRLLDRLVGLAHRREVGLGAHLQVVRPGSAPS